MEAEREEDEDEEYDQEQGGDHTRLAPHAQDPEELNRSPQPIISQSVDVFTIAQSEQSFYGN